MLEYPRINTLYTFAIGSAILSDHVTTCTRFLAQGVTKWWLVCKSGAVTGSERNNFIRSGLACMNRWWKLHYAGYARRSIMTDIMVQVCQYLIIDFILFCMQYIELQWWRGERWRHRQVLHIAHPSAASYYAYNQKYYIIASLARWWCNP